MPKTKPANQPNQNEQQKSQALQIQQWLLMHSLDWEAFPSPASLVIRKKMNKKVIIVRSNILSIKFHFKKDCKGVQKPNLRWYG